MSNNPETTTAPIRLNIGGGSTVIPGFDRWDIKDGNDARDLSKFANGTVDEIRASHVLEHLSFYDAQKALREWARVLKPGGRMRIAVPDVNKLNPKDPKWPFHLMGGQKNADDFHRSCWTKSMLENELVVIGLQRVAEWPADNIDTASDPISTRLEAYQGGDDSSQLIKIKAVMSSPRVGWVDAFNCMQASLAAFGIPLTTFTGAYWGQCLQNCLEVSVSEGVDWVLTLDYDTMFTKEHLDKLLGHFGSNPHVDALAGLQCRRSGDYPLMTIPGKKDVEVEGGLIEVATAHFGLTLIRLDSLKDVPRPWFQGIPSASGSWQDDDKIDDDIFFWNNWRKAGKTVFVAPDVNLGHLELMVSEFDEHMKPRRLHVSEWNERNGFYRGKKKWSGSNS